MEAVHNFQGSTPPHPYPNHADSSTFSFRGDDINKKKVSEIPPMHIPPSKDSLLLWETSSSPRQPHPSCSNVQERKWLSYDGDEVRNTKRSSKPSLAPLGNGQFREKRQFNNYTSTLMKLSLAAPWFSLEPRHAHPSSCIRLRRASPCPT